jgi:Mrp family chromosome partitioning ATPase
MPPSTASEVSSFFDNILSLLGVIIISQPSDISALGMTRTIDFVRHKGIPIMGLVTMMDGYLCPSCGLVTHQLLSPKLAMKKVAKDCGGIETLLRQTGEDGLEGATQHTQETNPLAESPGKGWRIGSNNCCQVHVR